uniref:Soluble scavenger receptor cysteine-rich domain-containing protein SSC5D n=1 Tax=Pelodiscus sinensis TaxID=13735 RepID=K7FTP9_PELSI
QVRLSGGPSACVGRVEISHKGRWGSVCDDEWDLADAAVVCRQLGCGTALSAPVGAWFGEGTGPIWLNEMRCQGSEQHLRHCRHRGWSQHVCTHEEDASAVCSGRASRNALWLALTLLGPRDHTLHVAMSLCPSDPAAPTAHRFLPFITTEPSVQLRDPRPPAQSTARAPTTPAHSGAPLRLVGGPHNCGGGLEVLHRGQWGSVCDDGWGGPEGAVVCRELGCGAVQASPGGAHFGTGTGPIWLDDVGCSGKEVSLRHCRARPWGRSNCQHNEDASVVCTVPSHRRCLHAGPALCAHSMSGWWGAVLLGGRWGTVCDDDWDEKDVAVVCRQLGCGQAVESLSSSVFGPGSESQPVLLTDVQCQGTEAALGTCTYTDAGHHCEHDEDAGVRCQAMECVANPPSLPSDAGSAGCSMLTLLSGNGARGTGKSWRGRDSPRSPEQAPQQLFALPDVRLVEGPHSCAGRVEVLVAGRWGTVCDDDWDEKDVAVVCRQLGACSAQGPRPAPTSPGPESQPVLMMDVQCQGTEAALGTCTYKHAENLCEHFDDVGLAGLESPGSGRGTGYDPFPGTQLPASGPAASGPFPAAGSRRPSSCLLCQMSGWWGAPTAAPGEAVGATNSRVIGPGPKSQPVLLLVTTQTRAPVLPQVLGLRTPQSRPGLRCHRTISHLRFGHSLLLISVSPPAFPCRGAKGAGSAGGQQRHTLQWTGGDFPPGPLGHRVWAGLGPERCQGALPGAGLREPASEPFALRLVDGPGRCAGRLEVQYDGEWGTVCDDHWSNSSADVVCRELGCGLAEPVAPKLKDRPRFGKATGRIWLDDVRCKGTEKTLQNCAHHVWGYHDCTHHEDISVVC